MTRGESAKSRWRGGEREIEGEAEATQRLRCEERKEEERKNGKNK